MNIWDNLSQELDLWGSGLPAPCLWLRDDDAIEPTDNLDRLAELTARFGVPVTIAVIPEPVSDDLPGWVKNHLQFTIVLHGFRHKNHAPANRKKCELGPDRKKSVVLDELVAGRQKLISMFGHQFINMLVPPWNRIDAALISDLPGIGIGTLSTYANQNEELAVDGLTVLNTHVDIIDWAGSRGGRDTSVLVRELTETFQHARKHGGTPVGILTHHLVHDEIAWQFLEQLFQFTNDRHDVYWGDASSLVAKSDL